MMKDSMKAMKKLLDDVQEMYDLVFLDMPPINIVPDPLSVSGHVAGSLFVTRQDYSDLRDIRKALAAAELTRMSVLGFVFYGERLHDESYYSRKYYDRYYHRYDYRNRTDESRKDDDHWRKG